MPLFREHEIPSELLSSPRRAWIQPATCGTSSDCLLLLDGELYTDRVRAPEIIRAAEAAGSLPPMNCVYLPNASAAGRHADYTCNENFASFIALEMPRWIEREVGHFDRLFLCGLSLSGLQAVFTALRHPGIFSAVLSQSPSAWWQDEWLASSLAPAGDKPTRFWLSVGTQELQESVSHPPTGLFQKESQLASVRRLAVAMSNAGHEVQSLAYDGGHDPLCWGAELPRALAWLVHR